MVRNMAASGVGVIYVTHRLGEVMEIAHSITVLRDGRRVTSRPVSGLDLRSLVSAVVGEEGEPARSAPAAVDTRLAPVLEVKDLVCDEVKGLSLQVLPGEIVGVGGLTGSGRETVLGAIFGARPRPGGTVHASGRPLPANRPDLAIGAGIAFMPSDRHTHGSVMNLTGRENISLTSLNTYWRWPVLRRGREAAATRQWFSKLDVRPAGAIEQPLLNFSGGNQQKILFAKWLHRSPLVLLLDEPTQGVDVAAKAHLHQVIRAAAADGAAVIVASSEAEELSALCHRILVLRHGRVVTELKGSEMTVDNVVHESVRTAERPADEAVTTP
jgi:ribose transport system ATP-binding protein